VTDFCHKIIFLFQKVHKAYYPKGVIHLEMCPWFQCDVALGGMYCFTVLWPNIERLVDAVFTICSKICSKMKSGFQIF